MVKYSHLLEDSDVKRWYDNLAAGSPITADVYLRGLGRYCELNNSTPKKILQQAETKAFRDNFIDFVRKLESQGKAVSYITRYEHSKGLLTVPNLRHITYTNNRQYKFAYG